MKKKQEKTLQNITIVGSKFFKLIKLFGLVLHIAAFIFGLSAIIAIDIDASHTIQETLEILTLIIVGLIIIVHFLEPLIIKKLIEIMLSSFWGENKIETITFNPKEIGLNKNGISKIKSHENIKQNENIKVYWAKKNLFKKRTLVISKDSNLEKNWKESDDKEKDLILIPKYIIIDLNSKKIRMIGRYKVLNDEDKNMFVLFSFDILAKKAKWSGLMPEYPLYGEWVWKDKKLK